MLALRILAAVLAFLVTAAVALLVDGMSRGASSLAWMCAAAATGVVVSLGIPLAIEAGIHLQLRKSKPKVGRQRTLAILLFDLLAAVLLVVFGTGAMLDALGKPKAKLPAGVSSTSPSGSISALPPPSASAPASSSASPSGSSSAAPSGSTLAPATADLPPEDLFDTRADTVVVLLVRQKAPPDAPVPMGQGSGFIVDPSGLVVTNEHVVHDADSIVAHLKNGKSFQEVTMLVIAVERDLALLQLPASGLPAAPLADGDPRIGSRALAIGAPYGLEYTLTDGIVSAYRDQGGTKILQFQTTIAPGSSGGPLFDARGRVIGVTTSTRGAGLNNAVSVQHVKELLAAPRKPVKLQPWGGEARIEALALDGVALNPSDHANLAHALRAATTLLEPCLRIPGPPKGSLTAQTSWPVGGIQERIRAIASLSSTNDLDGKPGECLVRSAQRFYLELQLQLANAIPAEYKGKVGAHFTLVLVGADGTKGRTLDVRLDIEI